MNKNYKGESEEILTNNWVPYPLKEVLESSYPEVELVASNSWAMDYRIRFEDFTSIEAGRFVTSGFYDLFSFEILIGEPSLLGIAITERLADKLMKHKDYASLIGRRIEFYDGWASDICAIISNPGPQSSLQFDWQMGGEKFVEMNAWLKSWDSGGSNVYFRIKDTEKIEKSIAMINGRIHEEIEDHTDHTTAETLWIQPFEEIYLNSEYKDGKASGGRIRYVAILTSAAILILIVAAINFINLTIAQTFRRTKEIGLRKVLGAKNRAISYQFLLEFFLSILVAAIISITSIYIFDKQINLLINKDLSYLISNWEIWLILFALVFVITLLSAIYPLSRLSNITLRNAVVGKPNKAHRQSKIRNPLVVFQFGTSFLLIFCSSIIYEQLQYMLTKDTGIKRNDVLAVPVECKLYENQEMLVTRLRQIPDVTAVSGASANPLRHNRSTSSVHWEGKDANEPVEINVLAVGDSFVEVMELALLKGRNFNIDEFGVSDTLNYMVNEAAASLMDLEDPKGKKLSVWGDEGKIIGVVKDFHFQSFEKAIAPLIIRAEPFDMNMVLISYSVDDVAALVDKVNEIVLSIEPQHSLSYELLEDTYRDIFSAEITLGKFALLFVIVSVIISSIGLFGVSSYQTEMRGKEVSIHKVFGATSSNILIRLCREYLLLFAIGIAAALPLGMYFSRQWLDQFFYRIDVHPIQAILSGLVLLCIGIASISYKSYRTSQVNPSELLKVE